MFLDWIKKFFETWRFCKHKIFFVNPLFITNFSLFRVCIACVCERTSKKKWRKKIISCNINLYSNIILLLLHLHIFNFFFNYHDLLWLSRASHEVQCCNLSLKLLYCSPYFFLHIFSSIVYMIRIYRREESTRKRIGLLLLWL